MREITMRLLQCHSSTGSQTYKYKDFLNLIPVQEKVSSEQKKSSKKLETTCILMEITAYMDTGSILTV